MKLENEAGKSVVAPQRGDAFALAGRARQSDESRNNSKVWMWTVPGKGISGDMSTSF